MRKLACSEGQLSIQSLFYPSGCTQVPVSCFFPNSSTADTQLHLLLKRVKGTDGIMTKGLKSGEAGFPSPTQL